MNTKLQDIDHIHVFVPNCQGALDWYSNILGLRPVEKLLSWAKSGPLMVGNDDGTIHIALFERDPKNNQSIVAFKTGEKEFLDIHKKVSNYLNRAVKIVDHDISFSFYFDDPYGNPYEITSYDHKALSNHYNKP